MNWDSIQQVLRILAFTGGGYVFGEAVTAGELFQQAVGGALALGAFFWWAVWERGKEHRDIS